MGGCGRSAAARESRRLHERGSYICKCFASGAATPSRSLSLPPATPGATLGFTRGSTGPHPWLHNAAPGATPHFASGCLRQRQETNAQLRHRTKCRSAFTQPCHTERGEVSQIRLYHIPYREYRRQDYTVLSSDARWRHNLSHDKA